MRNNYEVVKWIVSNKNLSICRQKPTFDVLVVTTAGGTKISQVRF